MVRKCQKNAGIPEKKRRGRFSRLQKEEIKNGITEAEHNR